MAPVPMEVMWLVSAVLVEAAVIDGLNLKVPNWLTAHFAAGGLAFAAWSGGWAGLGGASAGLALGLVLLLPLYAIGGMGAGDVKLMAGLGAWVGPSLVLGAFVSTALVGAAMSVAMIARSGEYAKHLVMFRQIGHEIVAVRDPSSLSAIAAGRKPTMMLLPYAIPIAVGSIGYFAWMGILA